MQAAVDEMSVEVVPLPKVARGPPGCSPLFAAISDIMFAAKRAKLEPEDLLELQPSDNVEKIASKLHELWAREVARAAEEKAAYKPGDKKKPRPPSLLHCLWPIVGGLWRVAFVCFMTSVGLSFVGPLVLSLAIASIERTQQCGIHEQAVAAGMIANASSPAELAATLRASGDSILAEPPPISAACREDNRLYMGYVFAGVMLGSKLLESVGQAWHQHLMTRVALRMRTGIISAIYRKCLWLGGLGSSETTTGNIQNLMANDAQFFLQFAPQFNSLFAAPIQIIISFVWLANIIGPAFCAGLGVMAFCMPLQFIIIMKYFKQQMRRLKFTDERVKLTNEMVQGMRVIKMYAWETTIKEKIHVIREKELQCVRTQRFLSALLGVFMSTMSLLVTVVTFAVYGAMGNEMTASVILPAMSLLALLRLPLAFIPMVGMQFGNFLAAIRRITKFLTNEELPDNIKQRSIEAGRQFELSVHSMNRNKAAAAGTAGGATLQHECVPSTPSFKGVCGDTPSAGASADDVSIRGSFRWPQPEVPVGKGKGKGKGKGGAKGGAENGGGRGGGRGGGSRGMLFRKPKASSTGGRGRGGSGGDDDAAGPAGGAPAAEELPASAEATAKAPDASSGDSTAAGSPGASPTKRAGRFSREGRKSKEEAPKPVAPPTLRDLDIDFPAGKLTMVAGAVGSGKSSILCALLGEMTPAAASSTASPSSASSPSSVYASSVAAPAVAADAVKASAHAGGITSFPGGEVTLNGQAGYFSQTPFILNDTVRGNILLGAPMDESKYQRTLHACALLPDLKILPGGDMTQIGEKGINLSGGQKARVALARAVYCSARVVLLDDPLSAVDAHVGKHIFREVLGPRGMLAGATRVLVTHQTQFLPLADKIVVMDGGCVLAQGSYGELRASSIDLSSIASLSDGTEADLDQLLGAERGEAEAEGAAAQQAGDKTKDASGSQLVKVEERASGSVSWAIHLAYLRAMGGVGFGIILLLGVMWERSVIVSTDYWLTMWIDPSSSVFGRYTPKQSELSFWIPIYFGGVVIAGLSVYLRSLFLGLCMGVRAARMVYRRLAASILAAPMLFFETTPSGRILNRFTSDTEQMDFGLLMQLTQWISCISSVFGSLAIICIVNPWFLCVLPAFGLVYAFCYWLSCSATRDLQRLEAVSRSPIFTQFSETLNGISTIRAFGATARFEAQSMALVAANTRCYFNQDLASQWVSLRLDACSGFIAAITVLLPTATIQLGRALSTSPAAFGLCINYALELSAFLKFGTKMTLELQKGMAAVERIFEYVNDVPSEPTGGAALPAKEWPASGRIVATNMCVRYRPELPLALDGVSCVIDPMAKVGVVGRTGSGKTTFVSALWRLVEPTCGPSTERAGALSIDGTDISTLELQQLRSRLAIIVQDPVLFNDSVRYNLDPFGEHSDDALMRVAKHAQLEAPIAKLKEGLGAPVGEAGANFSVGQRQLICLARAMLRESKVIVLDEATASIDNETDAILQSCIREVFADATVLTIAHRLHTIMDSTKIMLFDSGKLREYAPPDELLQDPHSLFSKLVDDTGSAADHLRQLSADAAAARR